MAFILLFSGNNIEVVDQTELRDTCDNEANCSRSNKGVSSPRSPSSYAFASSLKQSEKKAIKDTQTRDW